MNPDLKRMTETTFNNFFERGQKFLKHLQTVSTKLHGKHWLYTVLANRFNVC